MDVIPYTTLRANLASQMDRVCEDHTPLIVTRKASTSVVMISLDDYEAAALRLARDRGVLAEMRSRLHDARTKSRVFDASWFARRLEWGFTRMASLSSEGLPPGAFDIPEMDRAP